VLGFAAGYVQKWSQAGVREPAIRRAAPGKQLKSTDATALETGHIQKVVGELRKFDRPAVVRDYFTSNGFHLMNAVLLKRVVSRHRNRDR
jgi:hypothetical protein